MSKLLNAFQALKEQGQNLYELIGEFIIVEMLDNGEPPKTESGLYLTASGSKQVNGLESNAPTLVRVLEVGAGFYDGDSDSDVPLSAEPGDICLVGKHSVRPISYLPGLPVTEIDKIGLIQESGINMRFKGQDGYDKAIKLLGEALNNK